MIVEHLYEFGFDSEYLHNSIIGKEFHGLKLVEFLGRGGCGMAYLTHKFTVAKFTTAFEEIEAAKCLMDGKLPKTHFCKMFNIWAVDVLCYDVMIEKEYVNPARYFNARAVRMIKALNDLSDRYPIWDYDKPSNVGYRENGKPVVFDFHYGHSW